VLPFRIDIRLSIMTDKTATFATLHVRGTPLILFNVWDAGTAQAVTRAGAKAIATGSWSVAAANGFADGEHVPLDLVLANAARIVNATALPVSIDFEAGYGVAAAAVGAAARALRDVGVIGINLEDQRIGGEGLYTVTEQTARVAAAAATGLFVNARTDLFIKAPPETHSSALVAQALERAKAYAGAGAGSFFAPFLKNPTLIGELCAACPLPVNIMMSAGCPDTKALAALGVARISYGPGPYRNAMAWLEEQARAALA
jgi:2-methylisocitrate lyase-like PEP mutase family enzyme